MKLFIIIRISEATGKYCTSNDLWDQEEVLAGSEGLHEEVVLEEGKL